MIRRALMFLCFLAAAPSGGGVIDFSAPSGYTLEIRTYPVHGATPTEVDASLRTHGPLDESGIRRFAVTEWKLRWGWAIDSQGNPDLRDLDVQGTVDIVMPRLEGPAHLLPAWNRWIATMLGHERNHVGHLRGSVSVLQKTLRMKPGLSSNELNTRARRVVAQLRQQDDAYDRRTRNGAIEGVTFFSAQ